MAFHYRCSDRFGSLHGLFGIDMVRTFPESGAPVDNEFLADKTIRKLSVDNYVIYYKTYYEEKAISIIRIVYGKRNLDEILKRM